MSKDRPEIRSDTVMAPELFAWMLFFQSGSVPTIELPVKGFTGDKTAGLTSTSPICTVLAVMSASSLLRIPNVPAPTFVPRLIGVAAVPGVNAVGPAPGKIATSPLAPALTAALRLTF